MPAEPFTLAENLGLLLKDSPLYVYLEFHCRLDRTVGNERAILWYHGHRLACETGICCRWLQALNANQRDYLHSGQ